MSFKVLEYSKTSILYDFIPDAQSLTVNKSSWSPQSKIKELIKELIENGPFCVFGKLGRNTYVNEPFKMKTKIGDRDIYAWERGSERTHKYYGNVTVVGAKLVDNKEYIFLIDPSDGSYLMGDTLRKIYMISYKNLCDSAVNLNDTVNESSRTRAFHVPSLLETEEKLEQLVFLELIKEDSAPKSFVTTSDSIFNHKEKSKAPKEKLKKRKKELRKTVSQRISPQEVNIFRMLFETWLK